MTHPAFFPIRTLSYSFFMFAFMVIGSLQAQDAKTEIASIKQQVESKRYVFIARTASPLSGGVVQMTSRYTFTVLPDSIISDLPYFGRVYTPSMNPADAGMKFTSVKFDYSGKEKKKGGWEIKIRPTDVRNAPLVFLTISSNGYTTVRMSSVDRQAISYNGLIQELIQKSK
jgi:hypothetical protein